MLHRVRNMEKVLKENQLELDKLLTQHNHTEDYFADQWQRQREMQLSAIETGTSRTLYQKLESLVEMEDLLRDSE